MSEEKRRNFTEDEDVMLLRQVLSDRPFQEPRGKISLAWDTLAAKLVASEDFPRAKLSGKNAQSRFDKLVKARRHENEESLAASGVSEDDSERALLLDELLQLVDDHLQLVDDHVEAVDAAKAADSAKRKREEEAAATVRRLALESLSEDQESSPSNKRRRKEAELASVLVELKQKEIEDRKEARADSARERESDRAHILAMVEAVSKSILLLLEAKKQT